MFTNCVVLLMKNSRYLKLRASQYLKNTPTFYKSLTRVMEILMDDQFEAIRALLASQNVQLNIVMTDMFVLEADNNLQTVKERHRTIELNDND